MRSLEDQVTQLEVMSCEWRSVYMESTLLDSNRIWISKMFQCIYVLPKRWESKLHPNTSLILFSKKYSCIILRLNTYFMVINMIQLIIFISPQSRSQAFKNRSSGFSVSLQATQTRSLAPADKGRSVTTKVAITTKATRKSIPHRPAKRLFWTASSFWRGGFWNCWNRGFLVVFSSCLRIFRVNWKNDISIFRTWIWGGFPILNLDFWAEVSWGRWNSVAVKLWSLMFSMLKS